MCQSSKLTSKKSYSSMGIIYSLLQVQKSQKKQKFPVKLSRLSKISTILWENSPKYGLNRSTFLGLLKGSTNVKILSLLGSNFDFWLGHTHSLANLVSHGLFTFHFNLSVYDSLRIIYFSSSIYLIWFLKSFIEFVLTFLIECRSRIELWFKHHDIQFVRVNEYKMNRIQSMDTESED